MFKKIYNQTLKYYDYFSVLFAYYMRIILGS